MALTAYQKFVKANYKKYGGDFKKIGAAWRSQGGGSTKKSTSKPKPKTRTLSASTRPTRKPKEKATRKTAKQKAATKAVPVTAMEKRTEKYFQRIEQVRLALGIPKADAKVKITSKAVYIKMGFLKRIKRRRLSDAVRVLEQRARGRI